MISPRMKNVLSKLLQVIPDILFLNKFYLKFIFKVGMGDSLKFNDLKTLNEKMQYMKLYDKNDLYTVIADKLRVRDFVASRIGESYLIPLLSSGDDLNLININTIPKTPFIVKANHDCSGGLIVRDINDDLLNVKGVDEYFEKDNTLKTAGKNINYIRSFLNSRFKYNHYFITKEWQYKNIPKAYLFESLLSNEKGQIPNDYKFHCFNGIVEFIYVSVDREGNNYRKIYYPDWTLAPFTWTKRGKENKFKGPDVRKPDNLDHMIKLSEKLSKGFKYIRVDLYSDDNGIFFGELTMHQGSGVEPILPRKFDLYYGEKISL